MSELGGEELVAGSSGWVSMQATAEEAGLPVVDLGGEGAYFTVEVARPASPDR